MLVSQGLDTGIRNQFASTKVDARVVLLTHGIPHYQVRVFQSIAAQVRDFHVLLSAPLKPQLGIQPDRGGLNIAIQKSWVLLTHWKHIVSESANSFSDRVDVHVPRDTQAMLDALRPDVILSLELGIRSLGVVRYSLRRPQVKSVLCTYMSEYTELNRGRARGFLRRYLIKRADALTYNGPSCQRYLLSLGVAGSRLFPLPYAADDRSIYQGPLERNDNETRSRLVYVGQLSERKGALLLLAQLVKDCQTRPERSIEIRFIGAGPQAESSRAMSLPGNLKVRCLGPLPPRQVAQLMPSFGNIIAPTLADQWILDQWILVVNEGLQAGMPIIGSVYSQGVNTLVRHRENGWCYDPACETSLFQSLDEYFALAPSDLSRMRVAARQSVAERTPLWAAAGALQAIGTVLDRPEVSTQSMLAGHTTKTNVFCTGVAA